MVNMPPFARSMILAASICGIIASLAMFLAWPFAHMSANSAATEIASNHVAVAAVLVLLVSGMGLYRAMAAGPALPENPASRLSRYAIASVVLGFPPFGFVTWGLLSVAGMICGGVALKAISTSDEIRGRWLATTGICLSFSTLPLLAVLLLFLGP